MMVWGTLNLKTIDFMKVYSRSRSLIGNIHDFYPLSELVDRDKQVDLNSAGGFLQLTDHVESPLSEMPCKVYCI
jgi:hypothetical protein